MSAPAGRLVALALLLAGPAMAQGRAPSPCDWYIPTGEPLPRQDHAAGNTFLLAVPNPTWRDKRIAEIAKGEPVTILQECGLKLRVRTVRDEEGWIGTTMLPQELRLHERARRRPPATEAECAQRLLDPRLVEACRRDLAAKRAVETEAETAAYLPGGELSGYLAGKTVVLRPRADDVADDPQHPTTTYFAGDGEVFLRAGPPGDRTRWRGRWVIEGDRVCLPGGYTACARLRRLGDGRMVWVPTGYPRGYLIERSDGDSAGTVAVVRETYPAPTLPPTPRGTDSVAMPSLGR